MYDVLQSSASYPLVFGMYDSAGNAVTGLSPTVLLSKNGAATASPAGAVSEIGSGLYKVAGNATDTNTLGPLVLYATGTGAIPCLNAYPVVSFNPQSATAFITGVNSLAPPTNWNAMAITAAGGVAPDWANVKSPTATVGLTGTTISSSQVVASVSGAVGSVTGLTASNLDTTVSSRLAPTVAARTLDVAATGEAGLDFDNIKQATGATTLTNIRVPNVTLTDTVTTYTGNTVQTGDSFGRLGVAGVGLTNLGDSRIANLNATVSSRAVPGDAMALTSGERTTLVTAIWGALTSALTTAGSIGKFLVDSLTGNTPQTGDAYLALTGAQAEPGQGAPAVNASPLVKISWLYKAFRNKITQTSSTFSLFDDAGSTVDQKASVGDDGSTFTRGEVGSGP